MISEVAAMGLVRRVGAGVHGRLHQRGRLARVHASGDQPFDEQHNLAARGGSRGFRPADDIPLRSGAWGVSAGQYHQRISDSGQRVATRGNVTGVALILESVIMLCAAVWLMNRENVAGVYIAACACGLQNAMVSTYSGTVVRTTHLSGMWTEPGDFSWAPFARTAG